MNSSKTSSPAVQTENDVVALQPATLPKWLLLTLIAVGILAGIAGEKAIYAHRDFYFTPSPAFPPFPPEFEAQDRLDKLRNFAIGYGILGMLLLGLSGLVVGASKSPRLAILGGTLGVLFGLVAGAAAGPAGHLIYKYFYPSHMDGILKTVLTFGPIWLIFTFAAAMLGWILSRRSRPIDSAIVLGILLGCVAAIGFPVVCLIVFPAGHPEMFIADEYGIRTLGCTLGAICTAITVAMTARPMPKKVVVSENG